MLYNKNKYYLFLFDIYMNKLYIKLNIYAYYGLSQRYFSYHLSNYKT